MTTLPLKSANHTKALNALIAFCYQYASPKIIDENHVLDGFGKNRSLPPDSNDYCIVTPIVQTRSGTTVEEWDKVEDVQVLKEYVELDVQIDCYSTNNFDAMDRAQTYETIARSSAGVAFFNQFDMDCLYADGLRNLSSIIDDPCYVSRWTLTLHLGYWKQVRLGQDFFTSAQVNVDVVDVRFKP